MRIPHTSGRGAFWFVVVASAVAVVLAAALGLVVVNRLAGGDLVLVEGVVGSEKVALFDDELVGERFAELGYEVRVRPRGSRLMAEDVDGADFVSPGSGPASEHVRELHGISTEYRLFSTPMVLLSYQPVVDALAGVDVAGRGGDGTWSFDLAAYLELTRERTRWRDLPGDAVSSSNRNEVLVRTTDPRTSNSAAMHVAALSYLLNGEEVVTPGQVDDDLTGTLARLFLAQGQPPESSQQPFEQFRDLGAGHTPLLWAYESQYVDAMVNGPALARDAVVLYPEPTVYAVHTAVPFTEEGDAVGRLLARDPVLQERAAAHGFRTEGGAHFEDLVAEHGLPVRTRIADVVNTPTYGVLEDLLAGIEDAYGDSGARPPAPDEAARGGGAQ
ncbi:MULTISPECIES: hypothetical protein [Nocardiopsis]|uniref:Extracellular solute-binding protein n=1 Tax=Nocardiopsis sinuspersici TaxID=501010 RepID=A0A1V3BY53_9ACTN|nr:MULTISPECIES: hypothetical protein [Nocardiopsis]OOC53050.1 hypothetical protein NOSIN_03770 [Nocardiopsis sinuspersici]